MGNLTAHFSRYEFECPCCGVASVGQTLVNALEQLRLRLDRPIRITSGYRCRNHNGKVGGGHNSQHLLGIAADIVVDGYTPNQILVHAGAIAAFRKGGIGVYPSMGFTHLDVRPNGPVRWTG